MPRLMMETLRVLMVGGGRASHLWYIFEFMGGISCPPVLPCTPFHPSVDLKDVGVTGEGMTTIIRIDTSLKLSFSESCVKCVLVFYLRCCLLHFSFFIPRISFRSRLLPSRYLYVHIMNILPYIICIMCTSNIRSSYVRESYHVCYVGLQFSSKKDWNSR